MSQFIYKEIDGEIYASLNPNYKKEISQKKYQYFLEKSGIPNFYWDISFDDYQGEKSRDSFKKTKQYAENIIDEKFNHVHLYLWGISNSQKSAISCNIGKTAIKKGLQVKFVLSGVLIDKLMKIQGFTINEEIESYIKSLKQANLLIIDDMFDIKKSLMWKNVESNPLIISAWDSFLREVVASKTKIIMTSNVDLNYVKEKFGESIFHLIDRNFVVLPFFDCIKEVRKKKFENLWD